MKANDIEFPDTRRHFNKIFKKYCLIFSAAAFMVSGFFAQKVLAATPTLGVTQISAVQTFASSDGTFENGWKWVFDVTIPDNEPVLNMKFADWVSGSNSIPAANNIRFYSAESQNASSADNSIMVQEAGQYSADMYINPKLDLNLAKPGRQIQITVEARVPENSSGGSYSTSYGIKTSPDTTAPVITLNGEANMTVEAGPSFTDPGATAYDNVDGEIIPTISGEVIPNVKGEYVLSYNAEDSAHNKAEEVKRAVNVIDTTNPTIAAPENITMEATGLFTKVDLGNPEVSDNANPAPTAYNNAPEEGFPIGETTVVWTATDANKNTATANQLVTITDKTGPEISHTNDITVETSMTETGDVAVDYDTPSANDLVDGNRPVNCSPVSGSTFHYGTTVITCISSDTRGNESQSTFNINVVDNTDPVITIDSYANTPTNKDVIVTAHTSEGTLNENSHTFTENGSFNFVATDVGGHQTTKTITIANIDKTAPEILNDEIENPIFSPNNDGVKDTVSIDVKFSEKVKADINILDSEGNKVKDLYSSDSVTDPESKIWDGKNNSGEFVPDRVYTIQVIITDPAGNTATSASKTITVDTVAPTIDSHENMTPEATGPEGAVVTYDSPKTHDSVDGEGAAICSPASGSMFTLDTVTTVNCKVSDQAGNKSTSTFTINVQDHTAPVITGTPTDITAEATSADGAVTEYANPTATDLVDGTATVFCSPISGSTFPIGETAVNCTATDSHANSSNSSFKVKVQDTTPPSITAPADIGPIEATGKLTTVSIGTATASDLVDPSPNITNNASSGFPVGATAVNWTVTDSYGNHSSATQNITIVDTTKPVITILGEGNNGNPAKVVVGTQYTDSSATATDIVDGNLTSNISVNNNVDTSKVGNYTVTYSITDTAGNTAAATREVDVIETEYDVEIISNNGGSINAVAKSLQDATFKIVPNAGFHIQDVKIDNEEVPLNSDKFVWDGKNAKYTFINITGPHTIGATFEQDSAANNIISFNFSELNPAVEGVVNETDKTISLTVPFGTNLTALVPTISVSDKASVNPASGVEQNFTNSVTYTVTAESGATKNYIVTIIVAPSTNPTADFSADFSSLKAGSLSQFSVTVANIKNIDDETLIKYKVTATKDGSALAGQDIKYPEQGDGNDPSGWHQFLTDASGVAYFGPSSGFPLNAVPDLRIATGVTTPFAAELQAGKYTLQINIVKASDDSVLVSSGAIDFTVQNN